MNQLSLPKMTVVALIIAAWSALAVCLALSNNPWTSEAWFAIPALNLLSRGTMGTTVLASKGTWLAGIERHTYWIMPLHPLVQVLWYKLMGFSLFRQRLLSILFGAGALVSWFTIVLRLSGAYAAALVAVLIIGFEGNFLNGAANGRMDMMAAALGAAGLAAYLQLRDQAPRTSLLVSNSLVAAAVMTHPCGALFAVPLAIMMFVGRGVGPAAGLPAGASFAVLPWLVALLLWLAYIAKAPHDFKSQFFGNVSGFAGEYLRRDRTSGIRAPWRALWLELKLRYLLPFGFGSLQTKAEWAGALWLSLCTSALLTALCNKKLRSQMGVRILAASGVAIFLIMALFEGLKFPHYLIYPLPFAGAITAIAGTSLWRAATHNYTRIGLSAALLMMAVPQAVEAARHFTRNPLRTEFLPTAAWIQSKLATQDRLIGPAELGYVLGFTDNISDDVRMGFYTGLHPRFIVTSFWYRDWIDASEGREPDVYRRTQALLNGEYTLVLARGEYRVYEQKPR
jgi:4-amino-4-deoxy-L-arabinose transferase-like glycosyltransferase